MTAGSLVTFKYTFAKIDSANALRAEEAS